MGAPKAKGFPREKGDLEWFEQIWFAGNHSDIGGGYPKNESRLSDIALQWMIDAARNIPNGIKIDDALLRLHPSSTCMHHDECKGEVLSWFWRMSNRKPVTNAILHLSVYERFQLKAVLHYDEMNPYRPEQLRNHEGLDSYYERTHETSALVVELASEAVA